MICSIFAIAPRCYPCHASLYHSISLSSCVCVYVCACVRASILPAFLSVSVYVIQGSLAYEVVDIMLQMHTKQSCCHTVSEHKEQVTLDTRLSLSNPTLPKIMHRCTSKVEQAHRDVYIYT